MRRTECAAWALVPTAAFSLLLWALAVLERPRTWSVPWAPSLGIDLAFRLDGLSALMLLLITGIGIAVFVYAGGYLRGHPQQRRLFILLTAFMAAMIGCVGADDLFVLFVFWEMTSLTSFALVGFNHEDAKSRKSAQQALLVTASGGLAMFAGFILLAQTFGTSRIGEILAQLPTAKETEALRWALGLIMLGAFTKSAQVPFHFWLPNAMAAPTPVSAYLHSATMVKLGVYLLARLDPGFGEWALWQWTLQTVGAVTAGWAMLLALRERDLKRILAWSTVATLGALVLLVGVEHASAASAVAALLLAHGLYKAPLFFVAGNVDHGTGTRVIDRLGNLRRQMPWTATAAILAGLSMAGVPLTFGFVAKDVIHAVKQAASLLPIVQIGYGVFSVVAVAVAGTAAIRVFWRHPGVSETPEAHEGGASLVLPPLSLALLGIVLGAAPVVASRIIRAASVAMLPPGEEPAVELAIHIAPMLSTLVVTLALGAVIYAAWDPLHRAFDRLTRPFDHLGSLAVYGRIVSGIPRTAAILTRGIQHGRLPGYMSMQLMFASAAVAGALMLGRDSLRWPEWTDPSLGVIGACVIISIGAILASMVERRLVMMLAAGLVGYGSAIFFLFAGAPDVAFTQFIVETVFVIVVASILLKLKRLGRVTSVRLGRQRPVAMIVAATFATAVTMLFIVTNAGALDPALAEFFAMRSVPDAHGRNVVNVILVDFRALDTLGEITVVMLSFLAAVPLLAALRPPRRRSEAMA